nr:hypothetical protein [uncultured Rhodopila sp.]
MADYREDGDHLMADISDVEQAITESVTASLYPEGSAQSSVVGVLCRVYRGWPNAATLNADLSAGIVNVTIAPENEPGRTTTRYLPEWQYTPVKPGTTATATGATVTIGGTPAVGDVVGALIDNAAYVYRIQSGDAVELIAANLAAIIRSDRIVSLNGATISLPGAGSIIARAVCDCPSSVESRRQEKDVRVTCWCPSPPIRDAVAAAIDAALNQVAFLALADSTTARITYKNTAIFDQAQNALLYRRDLVYVTEYPTVTSQEQPSMMFGAASINGNVKYG